MLAWLVCLRSTFAQLGSNYVNDDFGVSSTYQGEAYSFPANTTLAKGVNPAGVYWYPNETGNGVYALSRTINPGKLTIVTSKSDPSYKTFGMVFGGSCPSCQSINLSLNALMSFTITNQGSTDAFLKCQLKDADGKSTEFIVDVNQTGQTPVDVSSWNGGNMGFHQSLYKIAAGATVNLSINFTGAKSTTFTGTPVDLNAIDFTRIAAVNFIVNGGATVGTNDYSGILVMEKFKLGAVPIPIAAPTNVNINFQNDPTPTLQFSWTNNATPDSIMILRSASPTGPFTQVAFLKNNTINTYTTTDFVIGNTYYYRVAAYKAVNSYSAIKQIFADLPPPSTPGPKDVGKAEYFFDSDPGYGFGTNIRITPASTLNDVTFKASLSSVPVGFHTLYLRVKDGSGRWSMTHNRPFLVESLPVAANNIEKAEYFIDTDPGYGSASSINIVAGVAITDKSFVVDLGSTQNGFHTLYVRVKDAAGFWSQVINKPFYKENVIATTNIVNVEYFIDTDPGFGLATQVPLMPSVAITDQSFSVNLSNLKLGSHILYIRAKDNKGTWGMLSMASFTITTTSGFESEISLKEDFKIYPNPSSGSITFSCNCSRNAKLRIMNIDGIELGNYKINGLTELSLGHLIKGNYIFEISEGTNIERRNIILY